jgi:hypothetical protein
MNIPSSNCIGAYFIDDNTSRENTSTLVIEEWNHTKKKQLNKNHAVNRLGGFSLILVN